MRQEHQANHEHGEHGEHEETARGHSANPGRRGIHWHPGHREPGADGVGEFEGVLGLVGGW